MNKVILNLQIACKNKTGIPNKHQFQTWLNNVIPKFKKKSEINISFVDEFEIHRLNLFFLGKNKPTNILSFPFEFLPSIKTTMLGDLVMCHKIIETEAIEQNKKLKDHMLHMLIHGCLHLLGYRHIKNDEAKKMELLEKNIMISMGYKDPYLYRK